MDTGPTNGSYSVQITNAGLAGTLRKFLACVLLPGICNPPKFAQLCSSHYASGQAGLREPILRHNTSMGSVLIHTHTHSHTQKQTFLAFVKVLQTSKFEDPICKRVDFFSTRPTHSALEWRPFRPSISKHLTSWGMRLKNQIYLQIGPLTSW